MKIIFMMIFTNISYIIQMFIVIGIAIDNIIINIKRYKLNILGIKYVIIDLDIFIQRIVSY